MRCTVGRVIESAERAPRGGLDRSTESCYRGYTERVKTPREEGSRRANYPILQRGGQRRDIPNLGGSGESPRGPRSCFPRHYSVPQGVTYGFGAENPSPRFGGLVTIGSG